MLPGSAERIHQLWDELADFDAASHEQALDHLLAVLADLVNGCNANWIGAVRMDHNFAGDPVRGWRPRHVHFLHQISADDALVREQVKGVEQGVGIDETTIANVALAGAFRVNRLCDLVPSEWFEGDYYCRYYRERGYVDAIWAGFPVSADAEVYYGIFRSVDHPPFTVEARETVAYALRGIKWFHRQVLLGHGLLAARSALTPMERQILHGLLTGLSEKQIAAAQGQSYHTTHEHIRNIYRKYGVNNRAAMMALWLGKKT